MLFHRNYKDITPENISEQFWTDIMIGIHNILKENRFKKSKYCQGREFSIKTIAIENIM